MTGIKLPVRHSAVLETLTMVLSPSLLVSNGKVSSVIEDGGGVWRQFSTPHKETGFSMSPSFPNVNLSLCRSAQGMGAFFLTYLHAAIDYGGAMLLLSLLTLSMRTVPLESGPRCGKRSMANMCHLTGCGSRVICM